MAPGRASLRRKPAPVVKKAARGYRERMDLGNFAAIWLVSVIAATYAAARAGKAWIGFLLGLVLGPMGALIAVAISGGLNLLPEEND